MDFQGQGHRGYPAGYVKKKNRACLRCGLYHFGECRMFYAAHSATCNNGCKIQTQGKIGRATPSNYLNNCALNERNILSSRRADLYSLALVVARRAAKKKTRDLERMTTFVNRKCAENLPFFQLSDWELRRQSFNSAAVKVQRRMSSREHIISNTSVATNTDASCDTVPKRVTDVSVNTDPVIKSVYLPTEDNVQLEALKAELDSAGQRIFHLEETINQYNVHMMDLTMTKRKYDDLLPEYRNLQQLQITFMQQTTELSVAKSKITQLELDLQTAYSQCQEKDHIISELSEPSYDQYAPPEFHQPPMNFDQQCACDGCSQAPQYPPCRPRRRNQHNNQY